METSRKPGVCPLCGLRVPTPEAFDGMWTGAKPSGGPAGGSFYHSRCRLCRAALVAYTDCSGAVIAASGSGGEPAPVWSLRGVPWQTIGLAVLAVATGLGYSLAWGRL